MNDTERKKRLRDITNKAGTPARNKLTIRKGSYTRGVETPQPFDLDLMKTRSHRELLANYLKGSPNLSARKPITAAAPSSSKTTAQAPIAAPTVEAIQSAGGITLLKHGYLQIRGSTFTSRYRHKFGVLEKGFLNIYNPKDVIAGQTVPTVLPPELTLSLLELRAIDFKQRGSRSFALVFGSNEAHATQSITQTLRSKLKRRVSMGSNYTNTSPVSQSTVYNERTYYFKFQRSNECESWLTSLLLEIKNQAKFVDVSADRLMHGSSRDESAEILLRQAVDLYMLSCGKFNKSTAAAQDRLGRFLRNKRDSQAEAKFWCKAARNSWKKLKSLEKTEAAEFILERSKLIDADSPLNQIQFQVEALYKMKVYKEKLTKLEQDAMKWKARALLHGYGSKSKLRQSKPELANLRFNKESAFISGTDLTKDLNKGINGRKTPKTKKKRAESVASTLSLGSGPKSITGTDAARLHSLPSVLNDTDIEEMADVMSQDEPQSATEILTKLTRSDRTLAESVRKSTDHSSTTASTSFGNENDIWGQAANAAPVTLQNFYINKPEPEKQESVERKEIFESEKKKSESFGTVGTNEVMKDLLRESLERDNNFPDEGELEQVLEEDRVERERLLTEAAMDENEELVDDVASDVMEAEYGRMMNDDFSVKHDDTEQDSPTKDEPIFTGTPACYLLYNPAGKGALYTKWSAEEIENALMKFTPGSKDKIPTYKLRVKTGANPSKSEEIIRNLQGTYGRRRMFQGVLLFCKEAVKYDANVFVFEKNVNFKVYYYLQDTGKIMLLPVGEDVDVRGTTLTVVELSSAVFQGISRCAKEHFMNSGRKAGAAMDL